MLTKQAYQTERMPMIEYADLANQDRWPKAESSKCCMFEAINIVGGALFGPIWTGKELHALRWLIQPSAAESQHQLLLSLYPKPKVAKDFRRGLPSQVDRSPIEHVLAWHRHRATNKRAELVEAEQSLWEANRALADRLTQAVDWIAGKCRDAMLLSFCRFISSGKLMPIDAHEWNCERPIDQFLAKGTYNRWFLVLQPPKQFEVYVFFDRANLQRVIASLAHSPVLIPVQDIDRLSPYLKLAVRLAIAKGYFSESQDETQAIREAEVKTAWADALPGVPQSKTSTEMIAKVMGFPNLKAIQQGQRALARKK